MPVMRGQGQLRGIFDDVFTGGLIEKTRELVDDSCAQHASRSMFKIDADIADVQDNWKTTGFYTVDQMQQINAFAMDVIEKAANAVRAATDQLQLPHHRDALMKALEGLHDSQINPMPYVDAVNNAKQRGIQVIESSGYKRWIVYVLKASRSANLVTTMVACARPEVLFGVLQALNRAADALVEFVKTVGRAIVAVGQAVLKIPDLLGSFFSVLKLLPWFVLVAGGYYVAVKTKMIPPKYDPLKLRERETFRPWRRLPPGGY